MFAVFFSLADFGYEPAYVELTGICAGNLLAVGGLFPTMSTSTRTTRACRTTA